MKFSLRLLYLYLFSFVGLIVVVMGSIRLVTLGLNVYIFKGADQYSFSRPVLVEGEKENTNWIDEQKIELIRQRQREFSSSFAMLVIGLPLYLYHWKLIKKENKS